MRRLTFFLLALLISHNAFATQEISAVCREPVGRMLGVDGTAIGKGDLIDEPDEITGGIFTIFWDGGPSARIISQGQDGGEPLSDSGAVVFESNEQVSFLVTYKSSIWLYSLYSKPKIMLITSHNNGRWIDDGGAVSKSFKASCEITANER